MSPANLTPEQKARVQIDEMLWQAGWLVQDWRQMDLTAAHFIAVREFPTPNGPADYLLYAERKAIGTIEAKAQGALLLGVEPQTDKYIDGFAEAAQEKDIPHWDLPLPFHYITTGDETLFIDRRDPEYRPRPVFYFHRATTLVEWIEQGQSLRGRLQDLPTLNEGGLRDIQTRAIKGLEESFQAGRDRSLVSMTMGAGKTRVAIVEAHRLIEHAKAERVLFLVDRINLGEQARDEFLAYQTPDGKRPFVSDYTVQLLNSNHIDPVARVVITTIQRLYAILRGQEDAEFDPESEEASAFELAAADETDFEPLPVTYQPSVPIETFDFVFTDEAHRSIYGRWGQVLDYFDAFLVGLTATPSKFTYGYFRGNIVTSYTHEQSVADGINVDYLVYRIRTEISEQGSEVGSGEYVRIRDRFTRGEGYRELEDELTYDKAKLDKAVVAPDQIRTIVRTLREKVLTEIFPGRTEVPKTVFFCKDDSHAEDVLQIVREEFDRGSTFARKITYKTQGSSKKHIQDFRTDPAFRIAVTVDQISTGTDIKAIECLVFMRMVRSRTLFEQMKGRGVRKMNQDEFWAITPGAREKSETKDHFVVVDAVGLSDEGRAWVDTRPLDREPSRPLKSLLQDVAQGIKKDDLLTTVASRLARLQDRIDADDQKELSEVAGKSLNQLASTLLTATDDEQRLEVAQAEIGEEREPTKEELETVHKRLVEEAVEPLLRAPVREKILSLQTKSEQIIDIISQDKVIDAGFVDTGEAEQVVTDFKQFIDEHHDEYIALKAYYEQPYQQRLKLEDIKHLAKAIETPPYNLTPRRVWEAYKRLDESKVQGEGGRVLTDIVSLVRFALERDDELVPHADVVRLRFDLWRTEQESGGREFKSEQVRFLKMIRDHIATSMTIERGDFDLDPFVQEGGLLRASEVFGKDLDLLLNEMNAVLAGA